MRLCKNIIWAILIVLNAIPVIAQDVHFTQYNNAQAFYNPACVGLFDGDFRINMNYKNQWHNVPVRYNTVSLYSDISLLQNRIGNDKFGMGFSLLHDVAGDARLSNTAVGLALGYTKALDKGKHFLSAGFQAQYHVRRFDVSKLNFEPDATQNFETFSFTKKRYISAGLGLSYRVKFNENIKWINQISMFNINQPNTNFYEQDIQAKVPMRLCLQTNMELKGTGLATIIPRVIYTMQGTSSELVVGLEDKIVLNDRASEYRAVNIGLYWRSKDAIALAFGFAIRNVQTMLSYDINYSKFETASKGNGGAEIAFIYTNPTSRFKNGKRKCPVF